MIVDRINAALRKVPAWPIYVIGALWAVWLFYQALTQQGRYLADPVNVLERDYGLLALQLLVAALAVSPLRRWPGLNLLKFRRAIGVTCFFFVMAHLLLFVVLDLGSFAKLWTEIVKRPYITVGFLSFLLLIPAAISSNNLSIRKLGPKRWKRIHQLSFAAAVLSGVHFLWLSKGFQIEPLVYLGLVIALLATRLAPKRAPVRAARA